MKKMTALLMVGFLFAGSSVFAVDDAEIEELIKQLSAGNFETRNKATKRLKGIGQPARKALVKSLSHRDPETRVRVKEILADIKLGISSSWPEDLCKQVRGFSKLKADDKKKLIDRVLGISEKEAMAFLINLVDKNDSDSSIALKALLRYKDKDALWKKVIELYGEVELSNKYQLELFAMAAKGSSDFNIIKKLIKNPNLPGNIKGTLVDTQITILDELITEGKFEKAGERAFQLSKSDPNNAMILYLRAEALTRLNRTIEAQMLANKALALNHDKEGPHYRAGEYLMKNGRLQLAEKEWKKILEIQPEDGVYDINAYIRLSDIYAKGKLYTKALKSLETGIEKYKKAKEKNGHGMGMVGAEHLDKRIKYLRQQSKAEGDGKCSDKQDRP